VKHHDLASVRIAESVGEALGKNLAVAWRQGRSHAERSGLAVDLPKLLEVQNRERCDYYEYGSDRN